MTTGCLPAGVGPGLGDVAGELLVIGCTAEGLFEDIIAKSWRSASSSTAAARVSPLATQRSNRQLAL